MLKRISFVLILTLIAAPAFAKSGMAVFEKYKNTEKASEKAMKTMTLTQTIVMEQDGFKMVQEVKLYKKGDKTRMESQMTESNHPMAAAMGKGTSIIIDDGITSTIVHPMMGKQQEPSDTKDNDKKPQKVKYIATEKVNGENCDVIEVTEHDGFRVKMWIAKKDGVLIKQQDLGDEDKTVTVNSNFKKVKGYRVPYTTESFEGGKKVMTATITSFKAGAKIEDSMFDPSKLKSPSSSGQSQNAQQQAMEGQMAKVMQMMALQQQLQELHQQGKTKEAQAVQKQIDALSKEMGAMQ